MLVLVIVCGGYVWVVKYIGWRGGGRREGREREGLGYEESDDGTGNQK